MRATWAAALLFVLGGCFSRPELKPGDAGVLDGDLDGGDADIDAPIDAACMPAMEFPDPQLDQLSLAHVSAGVFHVCAIDTDGALWCWGSNDHGQLGTRADSPGESTGVPGLASTMMGWTAVATSADHTCGISDEKVYCWGRNDNHQSSPVGGTQNLGPTEVMLTLLGGEVPTKVFTGPTASCAITSTSRAFCWGDLNLTVTGSDPPVTPTLLQAMNGTNTWSTMAIGEDHACAISETTGHLYCWGENDAQQLGLPTATVATRTFGQLAERDLVSTFNSVAVTRDVTCATRATDGQLVCFGSKGSGHLGVGTGTDDDLEIGGAIGNRVSINLNHVCFANAANEVRCYGDNDDGALGSGFFSSNRNVGGVVKTNVVELVAGERFTCALDTTNHLSCWGRDEHGELGLGAQATKRDPSPVLLPIGTCESVRQIVTGDRHSCAIVVANASTAAGRLYCWGNNTSRQVNGSTMETSIPKPVQVFPAESFSRVALGEMHTCALRDDGAIRCWGDNSDDQLGSSGLGPTVLPPIGGMPWIYVAAGSRATCAIRMGGELFCWGTVPGAADAPTPFNFGRVTEGSVKNWTSVALGSGFGLGTAIDPSAPNRVFVYGFADTGCQLAQATGAGPNGAFELYNTVHTRANVAAAQAAGGHLCIHMNDVSGTNKITCYGENGDNQVGPNGTGCQGPEDPVTPTGGWRMALPDVSTVTVARAHSCGLDGIGQPWCWGSNSAGELGRLPYQNPNPARVTDQRFAEISTGGLHTCGISDTRTSLSCWGENKHGQLGDNARFHAAPTPAGLVSP
ncbi:MAG: RCC1 domain-containing protein [Kofleriaceae bacterium]